VLAFRLHLLKYRDSMQTSIFAVFAASLLGSLHCAGMCGGFAVLCATNSQKSQSGVAFHSVAYHLGRLCTYILLGLLAAALGQQLSHWAQAQGLPQLVVILVSSVLILQGSFALLPALRRQETRLGRSIARILSPLRAALLQRVPRASVVFPFVVGLLSTLLPCPWLYSFVALAATTPSIPAGMLLMAVFWLGTLPLLLVFSGLTQILSPKLLRAAPVLSALLVMGAGFYSLVTHLRPHQHDHGGHEHVHEQSLSAGPSDSVAGHGHQH
jgi:sulfite exporter TauE/SafE